MDPADRPSDLLAGAECAACGRSVPPDDVRLLARRDDLAFAELPCAACGSVSLAIFVGPIAPEPGRAETAGLPAVGPDDVLDMHLFLDAWHGDLRSLVDRRSGEAPGAR